MELQEMLDIQQKKDIAIEKMVAGICYFRARPFEDLKSQACLCHKYDGVIKCSLCMTIDMINEGYKEFIECEKMSN